MELGPEAYAEILRWARTQSRREAEAEELAHDILFEAIRHGRTQWGSQAQKKWLRGAIRRRAAFLARSAARRAKREERHVAESSAPQECPPASGISKSTHIRELPPSLRSVAILLAAGLDRAELRQLLGVSDTALRQRIRQLRKRWPIDGLDEELLPDTGLAWGRLRQALLHSTRLHPRALLGAHDPDGHLLLFEVVRQKI